MPVANGGPSNEEARLYQLLYRNVQRFRGGLEFKAHRLVYHSTLCSRHLDGAREDVAVMGHARGEGRPVVERELRPPLLLRHPAGIRPTFVHRLCATTDHSENFSTESCTVRYSSQFKNNYFAEM